MYPAVSARKTRSRKTSNACCGRARRSAKLGPRQDARISLPSVAHKCGTSFYDQVPNRVFSLDYIPAAILSPKATTSICSDILLMRFGCRGRCGGQGDFATPPDPASPAIYREHDVRPTVSAKKSARSGVATGGGVRIGASITRFQTLPLLAPSIFDQNPADLHHAHRIAGSALSNALLSSDIGAIRSTYHHRPRSELDATLYAPTLHKKITARLARIEHGRLFCSPGLLYRHGS